MLDPAPVPHVPKERPGGNPIPTLHPSPTDQLVSSLEASSGKEGVSSSS